MKTTKKARRAVIMALARVHEREGELELDDNAKISEGDDNGAYVQMWRWVEFSDTKLCNVDPTGPDSDMTCGPDCPHHALEPVAVEA